MRIHHRTPTIFNLSMVDVLCCALGCVIMLWLLNLQEAKEKSIAASNTTEALARTKQMLDSNQAQLSKALVRVEQAGTDLEATRKLLASRERMVAELRSVKERDEKRLALLSQDVKSLSDAKDQLGRETNALQSRLLEKELRAEETGQRLAKATELLHQAEARGKQHQGLADQVPALREELKKAHASFAQVEARLQTIGAEAEARRTDLTDANRAIAALERDKKSLLEQVVRVTSAAENRFEGIALTGRRVIFLVDMSGSMELVDERTPDSQKWKGVRETLAKVMRSLPELSKYQIILFSDHVSYPLGGENRWLEFDPKGSVSDAYAALSRIRPIGATNMYDAFEAAFRYRPLGLDTVYVFSDGLPNIGPGLTLEQANLPSENERSTLLARHIRAVLRRDWNRAVLGQPRVRIHTIGFFYESPDVGAFLWALARENDGSFVGMSKP
jgi:hypothetical protein